MSFGSATSESSDQQPVSTIAVSESHTSSLPTIIPTHSSILYWRKTINFKAQLAVFQHNVLEGWELW